MRRVFWALSLAYMALIFALSAQGGSGAGIPAPWDKVAHAVAYTVLGYLLGRASGSWRVALVLGAWYGASDELHQAFVPGRMAGLDDWLADLLGVLVGARLAVRRERRRPDPQRSSEGARAGG